MSKIVKMHQPFAHIPNIILNGFTALRNDLCDLHEDLCTPENEHLAARLAETISLLRAVSDVVGEEFEKRATPDGTIH